MCKTHSNELVRQYMLCVVVVFRFFSVLLVCSFSMGLVPALDG